MYRQKLDIFMKMGRRFIICIVLLCHSRPLVWNTESFSSETLCQPFKMSCLKLHASCLLTFLNSFSTVGQIDRQNTGPFKLQARYGNSFLKKIILQSIINILGTKLLMFTSRLYAIRYRVKAFIDLKFWSSLTRLSYCLSCTVQIASFMGPTWGPPGSCWSQMGPFLAPWTLLLGRFK